jgi:hypothetical protein
MLASRFLTIGISNKKCNGPTLSRLPTSHECLAKLYKFNKQNQQMQFVFLIYICSADYDHDA